LLEVRAEVIEPPAPPKKIKGLISFEDPQGKISYEVLREDQVLKPQSGT